jgi:hypothetical protein
MREDDAHLQVKENPLQAGCFIAVEEQHIEDVDQGKEPPSGKLKNPIP